MLLLMNSDVADALCKVMEDIDIASDDNIGNGAIAGTISDESCCQLCQQNEGKHYRCEVNSTCAHEVRPCTSFSEL